MGKRLERYRGILLIIVVILVLVAVGLFQLRRPSPRSIFLSTSTPVPSPAISPTPKPLRVYVSGAVQQPDVYALAPDSIVKDAIMAAGGPSDDADLDRINLALRVADGQHIYVPRIGEDAPPVSPPSGQPAVPDKININTADLAALESLPGIGPTLAQRILDYRQVHGPFLRVEDIMEVSGVGPGTFEKLQDLIVTD